NDTKEILGVNHWIKNILPKQFNYDNEQVREFVANNKNLLNLLTCFVNFINANPGILQGQTYQTEDKYKKEFDAMIGSQPHRWYTMRFKDMHQAFDYLRN